MRFFLFYLKKQWRTIGMCVLFAVILMVSFELYALPLEAVLYPVCLCVAMGILFLAHDHAKARAKHRMLTQLRSLPDDLADMLPEARTPAEEDYRQLISLLCAQRKRMEDEMNARYTDMIDYYTLWAHQIKTPISAMRLTLQNEDSPVSRRLMSELFRVEQYVEMVLTFLRLDTGASDYVIRSCDLDAIARQCVKKFAGEFIGRRIRMEYRELSIRVVTDEKWLAVVIEQVLSNALKYTREGGCVSIYLEAPGTLCIRDTGIGIAPEDLPRIFENGYTGCNGRVDKRASGIGLHLCKRICDNLGHTISAQSRLDEGTVIRIGLERRKLDFE